MDIPNFFLAITCCVWCFGALGPQQIYAKGNQAQATKMGPIVYFKPAPPKVTTAEPSTESSQDTSQDNQQYYVADNYADYKPNLKQPKYMSEYGQTSEAPTYEASTPPAASNSYGTGDKTIQNHLDALIKLLLTKKGNTPKFLLLLPLNAKGYKPSPPETTTAAYVTTVKNKPRKKPKYIVVN